MNKHTPGPWQVDAEDSDLFWQDQARFWINADGMHVAYVDGPRNIERTANARLIAAAPEMLRTLIRAWEAIRAARLDSGHPLKNEILMVDTNERLLDVLDSAIAKATGGEHEHDI